MMSEPRRSSRRLSAKLANKEDVPVANGIPNGNGRVKAGKGDIGTGKNGNVVVNGASSGGVGLKGKRKAGM